MPLNPNGKIDKPILPFPDTAQASLTAQATSKNATERTMQTIWARILPSVPKPIPGDESFFDLGGHSILATRLIFEIRKVFLVDAPLGLVFEEPTISGLVKAVEAMRDRDLGIVTKEPFVETKDVNVKPTVAPLEYGQDYLTLRDRLERSYPSPPEDFTSRPITVFLTGATGFLGAFILRDLLSRTGRVKKVISLVRAQTVEQGLARLKEGATDRGIWDDEWVTSQRLEVVVGDLSLESFGLDDDTWKRISEEAGAVLHNGAFVHWVYPYEKLRAPNVLATLTAIKLASTGRPKSVVFVSSTSAIDTSYYVELSEQLERSPSGERGVLESDDLEGARADLKTGYGQSKWVSEKLLFEAGKRGLRGHIVRPGYVVGHSQTAGG
jgi:L-aminoadipate-semialdehyde dehydrogenase